MRWVPSASSDSEGAVCGSSGHAKRQHVIRLSSFQTLLVVHMMSELSLSAVFISEAGGAIMLTKACPERLCTTVQWSHSFHTTQINPEVDEAEREEAKLERMGLTPDWIIEVSLLHLPSVASERSMMQYLCML